MIDRVELAIREGKNSISVDNDREVSHTILAQPLRGYFINKVKKPLQKAIEVLSGRFPTPTKANTTSRMSHTLLDIFDEFHGHNKARQQLLKAAERILIDEIEHDRFYRDRFNWFLEKIIEAILDNRWELRNRDMLCWKEDDDFLHDPKTRYKETRNTVISSMIAHREEILAILGTAINGNQDTRWNR